MATYGFDEKKNLVEVPDTKGFEISTSSSGDMRLDLPNKLDISIYRDTVEVPANGSKEISMFKKLNSYYKFDGRNTVKTFVNANPNTPDLRQITATCGIKYDSDGDPFISVFIFNEYSVVTDVVVDVLAIGSKV